MTPEEQRKAQEKIRQKRKEHKETNVDKKVTNIDNISPYSRKKDNGADKNIIRIGKKETVAILIIGAVIYLLITDFMNLKAIKTVENSIRDLQQRVEALETAEEERAAVEEELEAQEGETPSTVPEEAVPEIKNYTEYIGQLLGYEEDEITGGMVYYFDIAKTGVKLQGDTETSDAEETAGTEEIATQTDEAPKADLGSIENEVGYRGKVILMQGDTEAIEVKEGDFYKLNVSDAMTMSIPPQAVLKSIEVASEADVEYFKTFKERLSNYEECLTLYTSGAVTPDEILKDAIDQCGYWTDEEVNAFKGWFKSTYADVQYDEELKFVMDSEQQIESTMRALEAEKELEETEVETN